MGEKLKPEQILAKQKTLKTIQSKIRKLVDNRIFASIDHTYIPEASFRVTDPKDSKKTQKISTAIDIGEIVSVEIPWEVDELPSEDGNQVVSAFQRLFIKHNPLFPRVHSFERGYYYSDGDESSESIEDSLTEVDAQKFLTALNKANSENEIDIFGQTRNEREENKAKADTLRDEIDRLIKKESERGNVDEYGDVTTIEQVRYMLGETKILVMRARESGICAIDVQGEDFMYPIKEDGKDDRDPDNIVRPRLRYIIPSERDLDQRIHFRTVLDPVEYGTVQIINDDIHFKDESAENIANSYDIRRLYERLTDSKKVFLKPRSKSDPEGLEAV
jgi:hypothetical protein